jgi:hypothetical protein
MPLQIQNLSELAPEQVEQMFQTLTQLMQERHPEVELTRGVFHDLVLYFNSVLNATVRANIDRVLQSKSLLKITQNPTLSEPELVDEVLSNFNISRGDGVRASGEATVVFLQPTTTIIPASLRLSAEGLLFYPAEEFTAIPPGTAVTSAADRQMVPVGDGTYAVNITVVAVASGAGSNIKRGAKLVPDFSLNNALEIYATTDFVNGAEPPTNAEYIARLPDALAAKTIGGRASYAATIRKQPGFEKIKHVSVVGLGEPEQKRDQHSLFPISGGGRVDVYLQTYARYQTKDSTLQAVYIGESETEIGTIWQIKIDKNVAPGFYEITRVAGIKDRGATGYQILLQTRGYNFEDEDFVPDIIGREEGAYSRYQTAVIRFLDPNTSAAGLTPLQSKAYYSVTTALMPLVGQVQDYISSRDIRSRAADVLVRAAVPCFTKISFTIRKDASSVSPDLSAIKTALVEAIAEVGFSGQLHASVISGVVHKFLTGKQAVGAIDMFGRILRPDGEETFVRDSTILQIPHDPLRLVTGKTTAFLTTEDDIAISVSLAGFTN